MEVHIKKAESTLNSDSIPRREPGVYSAPMATASHATFTTAEPPQKPISFANYSLSPIIKMPSFGAFRMLFCLLMIFHYFRFSLIFHCCLMDLKMRSCI